MKKPFPKVIFLLVCLAHTTGLCFASYSPPILETKNYKLETDSYAHTYDPLNRVIETKVAQTFLSAFSHDPLGNLIATTNALGKVRHWEYDVMNRRTAAIRPSGATDHFSYDFLGNNTAYTNAEGHVYTMAYDALGRMVAATNALGQQVFRNYYDNAGNLTNRVDGNGCSLWRKYDAMNRLSAMEDVCSIDGSFLFSYDAAGNMSSAGSPELHHVFSYDTMNRLSSAQAILSYPFLSFTTYWKRDLGGLVTNLTYAAGKSVSYTHDEDGNLTSVKDWLGNQWTFTYDPAGRLTGMSSPKVAQTFLSAFSYDTAGRLSSWSVDGIAGRTITYDAANRRIRDDITAGAIPKPTLQRTALNTFDAADRLISSSVRYGQGADSTPHITETFQYDGNGALTEWHSGVNYLYLSYDEQGRLDGFSSPSASSYFLYDVLGNRTETDWRCWITDHSDPLKRPLMEYDSDTGAVIRYYIWGGNRLLGFIDSNGVLTVAHSDEIGSVIALTDLSGNVLYSANYGPHGEDWGSTGFNPTPFTWLGGYGVYTLETGTPLKLYLTRYRVYSATLNRFLSADPMGLEGGLNLYAYGEGNPMAYIDPLGLCPQNQSYGLDLGSPFGPSHAMPDVSKYGIFSVLAPATFTGTTAYQDHYNSYTLPMLQTIASGYSAMTTIASVQQGLMVDALLPAAAARSATAVPQYYIADGVRRSVATREAGLNTISATIYNEGYQPVATTLNLNQLHSPKPDIFLNTRYLRINPPIQVPIEVQPLGLRGQLPTVPLNRVNLLP